MTSIAERNRRKRTHNQIAGLPVLGASKVAPKRGRPRADDQEDAARTALEARARQMGVSKTKAGDMRDQFLGDPAGMAIALVCGYQKRGEIDETKRLWAHYVGLTGAEARYHKSYGTSIYPKTAKIETEPQKMEVRPDDVIDLRTEEEKDIAADKNWMRWKGNIGMLESWMQTAIYDISRGRAMPVDAGRVTPSGERFVHAMRVMDKRMQEFGR